MELKVIASGSKGNCYLLHNSKESLMIEAGVPPSKAFRDAKLNIRTLQGLLVTHEHKDHARYVKDFLSFGLPVYMTKGTAKAIKVDHPMIKTFSEEDNKIVYNTVRLGNFMICPFKTEHDAAEPCGFVISHPEIGFMLFATDTQYLTPRFSGLTNIMIECNYDEQMLQERDIPEELKDRIRGSHMSIDTCIEALKANDLTKVNNVILIHLSEGSGDPVMFEERVKKATMATTWIAEPGTSVYLGVTPF